MSQIFTWLSRLLFRTWINLLESGWKITQLLTTRMLFNQTYLARRLLLQVNIILNIVRLLIKISSNLTITIADNLSDKNNLSSNFS